MGIKVLHFIKDLKAVATMEFRIEQNSSFYCKLCTTLIIEIGTTVKFKKVKE